MKLIEYRDQHMSDYIYFWVVDEHQVSPAFNSEQAACDWLDKQVDAWDNWKPSKDIA